MRGPAFTVYNRVQTDCPKETLTSHIVFKLLEENPTKKHIFEDWPGVCSPVVVSWRHLPESEKCGVPSEPLR